MMYEHGPGGGTLLVLPIDQGLEHGPVDFFVNPEALDPAYQFELAVEGRFSAIAVHIGLAEKYYPEYAGRIPLLLKLNGKTSIPPDHEAFSALTGTVEDAVRLGADAVGYTVYVGSSSIRFNGGLAPRSVPPSLNISSISITAAGAIRRSAT